MGHVKFHWKVGKNQSWLESIPRKTGRVTGNVTGNRCGLKIGHTVKIDTQSLFRRRNKKFNQCGNKRGWNFIEISQENELANFDDSFKLVLNTGNWGNLMENSSKKLVSNIISVCGDTHCGKSTIIGALLREANKYFHWNFFEIYLKRDGKCPDVAAPQQLSPTTANVQYYDSGLIENVSKIRFLDLEGIFGGGK